MMRFISSSKANVQSVGALMIGDVAIEQAAFPDMPADDSKLDFSGRTESHAPIEAGMEITCVFILLTSR